MQRQSLKPPQSAETNPCPRTDGVEKRENKAQNNELTLKISSESAWQVEDFGLEVTKIGLTEKRSRSFRTVYSMNFHFEQCFEVNPVLPRK